MTLKPLWFWTLVSLVGVAGGLALTAMRVRTPDQPMPQTAPWNANLLAGSVSADSLTRARVAVGGLLALGRNETLYYTARQDSEGRPLLSRCEYRISGAVPDARWWSITAYAEDLFLFSGAGGHYSVNSSQALADGAGRFSVRSGPEAAGRNGAPVDLLTPGTRPLLLTLRLYNPSDALQTDPGRLQAPVIERLGACS